MKCDDDVLYNITNMHQTVLQQFQNQSAYSANFIYGSCSNSLPVVRNESHKWSVPESLYLPDRYPKYCFGPNYVISRPSIPILLNQTKYVTFIPIEDAFVGILAQKAGNVNVVDIPQWLVIWRRWKKPKEYRKYLTIHTMSLNLTAVEKLWTDTYMPSGKN